ncbi:hypothetical protein [Endozoicomonas sp. ONNA2]|uniref:hypothetical protein n=1 Tax=Endozoicomonas sp. ONNA2 TaxID=2828741 RepID=UPI002148A757|nr:hypothetical protein [Endozoicomonas sp. ONNA2]
MSSSEANSSVFRLLVFTPDEIFTPGYDEASNFWPDQTEYPPRARKELPVR